MNSRPLSLIVYFTSGLISLFWSLSVIIDQFGFLWGVLALLLFPISILLTPLYVGFTTGHWLLAAITYGGGLVAALIHSLAEQDASATHASADLPGSKNETTNSNQRIIKENNDTFPQPWLIILVLVGLVIWKTNSTNLEYAATYYAAFFVVSLIVYTALSFFTKSEHKKTLPDWLNGAAYTMLAIIALSLLVRSWSERQIQYAKNPDMSSPTLSTQSTQRASTAKPSLSPSIPAQAPPQPIFQQPSIAGQGVPLASDQLTKEVQRLLLDLGFNPGAIDGKFGPRSKRALDEAQRSLLLPPTGAVSIEVRDQLRRALSSRSQPEYSTAPPTVVVSRSGATSSSAVSRA